MTRHWSGAPPAKLLFIPSEYALAQLARMIGQPAGPAALLADRRQPDRAALLAAEVDHLRLRRRRRFIGDRIGGPHAEEASTPSTIAARAALVGRAQLVRR